MTNLNPLLAQAQASEEDQTQTTTYENELTPAGPTFARFIGYVEVGKRQQKPYQGKPKPDAAEVRFTFELNGPKHVREIEVDGETKRVTNVISIKLTKKTADNSGFIGLFRKMTYGRDKIKNFTQMLGEPFLITIVHSDPVEKDGKTLVYANMKDADFNYLIGAPSMTDPRTGELVNFDVPEASIDMRLLLWNNPTKEQWASIFIDGTRTVKRDGKDVEESKNWLQQDIVQNALDFPGSPLEAFLAGVDDLELPGDMTASTGEQDTAEDAVAAVVAAAEAAPEVDGLEGPIKGTHADLIIVDDPAEDAPTPDAAAAAQAIFDSLGVGAPNGTGA